MLRLFANVLQVHKIVFKLGKDAEKAGGEVKAA